MKQDMSAPFIEEAGDQGVNTGCSGAELAGFWQIVRRLIAAARGADSTRDSRCIRVLIHSSSRRGRISMAVEITRTELSAADLRREAARAKDAKASRRMLVLALVLDGRSRTEAAESCGRDRQTLR